MSLLNDLGFANWRFVISTVDHIANLTETGTWTLSLSRAVASVVSGSNNYVRMGNMVLLECRFSVTSSESGTAYIGANIPTFNKTRTTVVGSWYDNNTDRSGQLVSYGNGTIWFTQAGEPHALTNQVGHNVSISIMYGLY